MTNLCNIRNVIYIEHIYEFIFGGKIVYVFGL
jgi:hypothetical protein